jgi:hypothetical protein
MARTRGRGILQALLLVTGMVAFAVPWRAASGGDDDGSKRPVPCQLPPGHPAVACSDAAPALPPGHPPVEGRAAPALPPGHPPIDGDASATRPGVVRPAPLGAGHAPRIFAL